MLKPGARRSLGACGLVGAAARSSAAGPGIDPGKQTSSLTRERALQIGDGAVEIEP